MKKILASLALTMSLGLTLATSASADIFGEIGKLPKAEGFGESLGDFSTKDSDVPPTIQFFVNAPQLAVLPGESGDQYSKRLGTGLGCFEVKKYVYGYFPGTSIGITHNYSVFDHPVGGGSIYLLK